ncbi:MAG: efflux RND transporter periplasmic adaptor subunit [Proteobacteria bacterium]|nr:efflux RND transporter periplasmic adaptor subunit [Pseudomonadota bacterium]
MFTTRRLTHPSLTTVFRAGLITTILLSAACGQSEDEKNRAESERAQNAAAVIKQAQTAQANNLSHPYSIEIAQSAKTQASVALGGSVIPQTELTIRAQAPGRVVYIAGEEGYEVRRGETIVDLDDNSLLAQRRAAIAGLQRARAQLNNAYIQLDQNIVSDGVNSRGGMGMPSMFDYFVTKNMGDAMGAGDSDYDRYASISSSRAGVEQAKSGVMEAESHIDQIEAMFRDKQAIAPQDAIILDKMIELGDAVQPGQALLRIGDTTSLQIVVDVPARLMRNLSEGMLLPISLNNTGETVNGEITVIFPAADVKRNTVRMKLALPQDAQATPGMYVTVSVPDSGRDQLVTISIPNEAVVWRGSQASVYIVNNNGKAELRMVRTGSEANGRISILSGLTEGDRIVTTPDTHLRSGMMIQTTTVPIQSRYQPRVDILTQLTV